MKINTTRLRSRLGARTKAGRQWAATLCAALIAVPVLITAAVPIVLTGCGMAEPITAAEPSPALSAQAGEQSRTADARLPVGGLTEGDLLLKSASVEQAADASADAPADADIAEAVNAEAVTQESIARSFSSYINLSARSGSRIYYPYPSGAMAVDLYLNGRRVLQGQCADIGGEIYVPVQRFAELFGSFKTTYEQDIERVTISGTDLYIDVKVGESYITVNERIFYTGTKVLSLGGWIFVPLSSMAKAMDASLTVKKGYYEAYLTSGDPSSVVWADDYYNATDLYWLSRIISAEAKGEPFAGQIAVGNVVLNRVRSADFPNTVKGVVFDSKYGIQFSPVASGTIYNTPTSTAVMAAKICLEGYSLSDRMIYFYNPSIATSSWIGRTRPYIMTVGNHRFYG